MSKKIKLWIIILFVMIFFGALAVTLATAITGEWSGYLNLLWMVELIFCGTTAICIPLIYGIKYIADHFEL